MYPPLPTGVTVLCLPSPTLDIVQYLNCLPSTPTNPVSLGLLTGLNLPSHILIFFRIFPNHVLDFLVLVDLQYFLANHRAKQRSNMKDSDCHSCQKWSEIHCELKFFRLGSGPIILITSFLVSIVNLMCSLILKRFYMLECAQSSKFVLLTQRSTQRGDQLLRELVIG